MAVVEAISDLHGQLPRDEGGYPAVPPCDVLVIAGDICPDFHGQGSNRPKRPGSKTFQHVYDKGEGAQANWLHCEFRDWLEDVLEHSTNHVVGIAGNHDFVFERKVQPRNLPWTYLWDEETVVDGLRFYGTPWCPKLGRWAFYGDDRKLKFAYEAVPNNLDVLISHSPPYGYGDFIPPSSPFNALGVREINVGTHQLTNILWEKRPKAVVSGHIHEARGRFPYHAKDSNGDPLTVVYNVSHLNELYEPYPSEDGVASTTLDVLSA